MLIKLRGLHLPAIEMGCPDLSLLTPEEQGRVWELSRKCRNSLQGVEPGVTPEELREVQGLLGKVPTLLPGEKFAGPRIEVPRALKRYWDCVKPTAPGRGYRFDNLGKVETLRFVELCKFYSVDGSLRGWSLINRILPLDEWQPDDKDEIAAMLEKAAGPHEPSI
jgi:hypothetical protein